MPRERSKSYDDDQRFDESVDFTDYNVPNAIARPADEVSAGCRAGALGCSTSDFGPRGVRPRALALPSRNYRRSGPASRCHLARRPVVRDELRGMPRTSEAKPR